MNYSLSNEGLIKIPFDKFENNFTFIVNGNEIKTNRFIADILSPIIRNLHYSDNSIETFSIYINILETKDSQEGESNLIIKYFEDFLKLINFQAICVNSTQQKYFSAFFYELGNIDEYFRLQPYFLNEINTSNSISRLIEIIKLMKKHSTFFSGRGQIYDELVNFISANFESVDKEELKKLDNSELDRIINNEKLKIQSEDSLFKFVLSLYEKDQTKSFLFDYVIFPNLSQESLQHFTESFRYDDIDESIWRSICSVISPIKIESDEKENRYLQPKFIIKNFDYQNGVKFNGILKHLTDESKGNILENETVVIKTTSVDNSYPLRNLVDFQKKNYFRSGKESQTIYFDFKDKQIQVKKYAIQTGTDSEGYSHLKSWAIEVSNDKEEWTQIDLRENNSSLNGNSNSEVFCVQNPNSQFYRFVRLRQIGYPWTGKPDDIEIAFIELYGSLKVKINHT